MVITDQLAIQLHYTRKNVDGTTSCLFDNNKKRQKKRPTSNVFKEIRFHDFNFIQFNLNYKCNLMFYCAQFLIFITFFLYSMLFFLVRREVKNKKNGIINNEKKLNKIFATK
jgi:hypothetical protein